MTAVTVLGLLVPLLGVLALVAAAAVYVRAGYAKARIQALNDELAEEGRRVAALRVDVAALKGSNETLEAKVVALNELVTQRAQLDGLRASIADLGVTMNQMARAVDRIELRSK